MDRELKEAYGKVDGNTWLYQRDELTRARNTTLNNLNPDLQSLREDYEVGIYANENMGFDVVYSASCDVCGFKYQFAHNVPIEDLIAKEPI